MALVSLFFSCWRCAPPQSFACGLPGAVSRQPRTKRSQSCWRPCLVQPATVAVASLRCCTFSPIWLRCVQLVSQRASREDRKAPPTPYLTSRVCAQSRNRSCSSSTRLHRTVHLIRQCKTPYWPDLRLPRRSLCAFYCLSWSSSCLTFPFLGPLGDELHPRAALE